MRRPLLAVAVLAAAIAVTAASALAKPKIAHSSCASFVSVSAVAAAIGPGTTIKELPATTGPFYDFKRHRIAGSGCALNWTNPTPTTLPVGDPAPTSGIGPGYWRVEWNLKPKVWKAQQAHEAASPVECSGACTVTQTPLQLGYGSKAYVETVTLTSVAAAPPVNYVYVYSANHNFLEIFLWPVSLSTITGMIEPLLAHSPPDF